jgi:hypothetical protein
MDRAVLYGFNSHCEDGMTDLNEMGGIAHSLGLRVASYSATWDEANHWRVQITLTDGRSEQGQAQTQEIAAEMAFRKLGTMANVRRRLVE